MSTAPTQDPPPAEAEETVPLRSKLSWGVGGVAENVGNNALINLVFPIYQIGLGLSPMLIGWAMAASRVFDAVTDTVVGYVSDNTRSRWGRRRPYILGGAILMAIVFALIWLPTRAWEGNALFWYLTAMSCLFYFAYGVFIVPYLALGCELPRTYEERTALVKYRLYPAFAAGLLQPWLYKWTLSDFWGHDEVVGARYVGMGVAFLILISALPVFFFCKERLAHAADDVKNRIKLIPSIKYTFQNRPFALVVGMAFLVYMGLYGSMPLLGYINIFYICGGDKPHAAGVAGIVGTASMIMQLLYLPLVDKIARRVDKHKALGWGLLVGGLGFCTQWFLFSPEHPYLQIIPQLVYNFGLCFAWVLFTSLIADVCDDDELKTGARREGMFNAVFSLVFKASIGIMSVVGGALLTWAGIGGEKVDLLAPEVIWRLRLICALGPTVCLTLAAGLTVFYPLTRKRVEAIQAEIAARKTAAKTAP